MKLTDNQIKAYKALKNAIKKCENCGLGIGMEDYSIYVGAKEYIQSFDSPWHFLRAENMNDDVCIFIESSTITGAGGA